MAQLGFTIADANMPELVDALADHFGYRAMVMIPPEPTPQPNPETKAQFVRRNMIGWFKERVLLHRQKNSAPPTDVTIT